jgi:hypothetical protein
VPAELPNRSVSVDYPKTAPDMRFRWETFTALTRSQAGLVDVRLIVHGTPPCRFLNVTNFANPSSTAEEAFRGANNWRTHFLVTPLA